MTLEPHRPTRGAVPGAAQERQNPLRGSHPAVTAAGFARSEPRTRWPSPLRPRSGAGRSWRVLPRPFRHPQTFARDNADRLRRIGVCRRRLRAAANRRGLGRVAVPGAHGRRARAQPGLAFRRGRPGDPPRSGPPRARRHVPGRHRAPTRARPHRLSHVAIVVHLDHVLADRQMTLTRRSQRQATTALRQDPPARPTRRSPGQLAGAEREKERDGHSGVDDQPEEERLLPVRHVVRTPRARQIVTPCRDSKTSMRTPQEDVPLAVELRWRSQV